MHLTIKIKLIYVVLNVVTIKYKNVFIGTIKTEVNTRLTELGYDSETIDSWMEHIDM
jgi:hypothetical protein